MTAFERAQWMAGKVYELSGETDHPAIQWGHMLCGLDPETPDEIAWCSSGLNLVCAIEGLPRSRSAAARSWLNVGSVIEVRNGQAKNDVVILKRGKGPQPGQEVLKAPGHVGLFAGYDQQRGKVSVLGGNQGNKWTIQEFDERDVLGVRRLI